MRKLICSILLGIVIAAGALLIINGAALAISDEEGSIGLSALPGVASCPAGFKEQWFVPYARSSTAPATCQTIITCTNLDPRNTRTFLVQFYFAVGNVQVGDDASYTLGPGETAQAATAVVDPFGIFLIDTNAATGSFEGKAIICADKPKFACDAWVSCDPGGVFPLKIFKNKQKGN